jgi:hypothetical protein
MHHGRALNLHSVRTTFFFVVSAIALPLSVSIAINATATSPVSIIGIIGSCAVAAFGLLCLIVGVSELLKRRSYAVESEIRDALGVEVPQSEVADDDLLDDAIASTGDETPSGDAEGHDARRHSDRDTADGSHATSRYAQNIFVTFKEGNPADTLKEFVLNQSDGNARLVIKYYAQGYLQASLTFFLSIVVALAGFALACLAIVSFLRDPELTPVAVVTAVVSAVTEIVGFLFFRRADKARDLMTRLIDKLREDRRSERDYISSLVLIDSINSAELQDALRVAVVSKFADTSVKMAEIEQLAARAVQSAPESRAVHIYPPDMTADRQ